MGPCHSEQLEFFSCGQILQDEEQEELNPAQIFLILQVKETFPTVCVQIASFFFKFKFIYFNWRLFGSQKGSDVNRPSSVTPILATRCACTYGR